MRLVLPGNWQLRVAESGRRWIYRSVDHREQITIGVLDLLGERDRGSMKLRVAQRHRRALELGLGREPEFSLSEPEETECAGVEAVCYEGEANAGLHYFYTMLFFPLSRGWSVFYEAFRLERETAKSKIRGILDSIILRE